MNQSEVLFSQIHLCYQFIYLIFYLISIFQFLYLGTRTCSRPTWTLSIDLSVFIYLVNLSIHLPFYLLSSYLSIQVHRPVQDPHGLHGAEQGDAGQGHGPWLRQGQAALHELKSADKVQFGTKESKQLSGYGYGSETFFLVKPLGCTTQ